MGLQKITLWRADTAVEVQGFSLAITGAERVFHPFLQTPHYAVVSGAKDLTNMKTSNRIYRILRIVLPRELTSRPPSVPGPVQGGEGQHEGALSCSLRAERTVSVTVCDRPDSGTARGPTTGQVKTQPHSDNR